MIGSDAACESTGVAIEPAKRECCGRRRRVLVPSNLGNGTEQVFQAAAPIEEFPQLIVEETYANPLLVLIGVAVVAE